MNSQRSAPIRAFVSDLYFSVRIDKMADSLGYQAETAERWIEAPAALLVFDLDHPAVDWEAFIKEARRPDSFSAQVPILAFGSHVNAEKLVAARRAGADMAVAKSRFVKDMRTIFQTLLGRTESE